MNTTPQLGMAEKSIAQNLEDGARQEPAKDVRGKLLYLPPQDVKSGIDVGAHEAEAAKWDDAVKSKNYAAVEQQVHAVRSSTPSYNEAEAQTIARAMAKDHRHVVAANEAAQQGNHVRLSFEDGSYEQGIIKPSETGAKREGVWHRVDSQGTTAQIAEFKDGQLHGENRFYDRNNQLTHRGYFQEGKAEGTQYDYADVEGKRAVVNRTKFEGGQAVAAEEEGGQRREAARSQAR